MTMQEPDEDQHLCPFSKPILGQWCACEYALVADRCSGKMLCAEPVERRDTCLHLVQLLKANARFTLNLSDTDAQINHAQAMKIKCGGILGMQRILTPGSKATPSIVDIIDQARGQYGNITDFPYGEIIRDISSFNHRKAKKEKKQK
jgi:hypothetical protein